ncbi:thiol methyltransferase 1 [Marasmius fiardii PR-910]|nr:thiol methyltransferase 1 [Marasmius fiardii PR-910]
MALPSPEERKQVQRIVTDDPKSWDELWKQNITPWDGGQMQPPLRSLIESKELDFPATGRALVPGCGSGYDAVFLGASLGYDVLGLDISPVALEKAQRTLQETGIEGLDSKVKFQAANFFDLDPAKENEKFDLVYDYTFFVAIPPSLRATWGSQMSKLVKQNGYLITLIYPMLPYTEAGPPFYVRPEHYPPVLGEGWEKVVDKVPDNSAPSHIDMERLVVWRKL